MTIAPHETLFWRHQRKASDHLATIEAIYFFLREYHETYLTAVPPAPSSTSTTATGATAKVATGAALYESREEPSDDSTSNHNTTAQIETTPSSSATTATDTTTSSTLQQQQRQQQQPTESSSSSPSSTTTKVITPHKEWIDSHQLGPYTHQFDDMLWFYKYFYELIQKTYRERTDGREFTLKHTKGYIRYDDEPEDERKQQQ